MTEQNLTKLTINTLTKSQYQALYNSGDISYTEIYLITDDNGTGVYALANNVYTKAEIDEIIANLPSGGGSGTGVDLSDYYTKSEITALLANKANTSDLSDYVEIADLANVATSGDYNDLSNTPTIPSKTSDLTNDSGYVSSSSLSTVATSGSYNDLSNKPDLTVYETKAEAFSGDYDDLTNKPDLSAYQTIANAFSGSYNDLTDKPTIPTIPTNISSFTNDSGYQTASNVNTAIATALTGYATESYVQTAVQNLGNVFTIKGSVSTVANLPSSNNSIGDVYYVAEKQAGYIWIEIDNVAQWEELGETIDLSNYVQTSDLTWNNISSKPTFATVATSGDYNDLLNKPTISSALSGGTWINIDSNNNINVSNPYISLLDSNNNPRVMISSTSNGTAPTFTATYCNITPTGFGIIDKTQGSFGGYSAAYTYYRHRNILVNNQWTLSFPTDNGTIATREWVNRKGYSTVSVSGTNDGTNWTSITIGSNTYNIPSGSSSGGSTSGDYVTLATDQNITGVKTFLGQQKLKFKRSSSSDILGFTAYDNSVNDVEIGNLQVANRTVGGSSYTYVTLGNYSSNSTKSKVGFRLQPNNSSNSFNFVMPYGTYSDFNANTYATNADITIPCAFTDGTTTIKANASGLVDLSSLNLGGGSSTSGSVVTGTNDGTNWTSLTINGSTYNIPAGGSSSGGGSSAGTGAIYYHNVRLFFGNSDTANYAKVIEFSILTKSATQILTMNELISQVSALQNEPYNDSVVGVIYGQVYQYNNRGAKEQILGFGLTGTSSSPNFYAVVRNNSGRTSNVSISATNSTSFTQTIQWINNLQYLRGYERTNNCYDIVTGGASSTSGSGIVDINDIPLVEGELAIKQVPVRDEQTGEPLVDGNGDPITEEQLGIDDDFIDYVSSIESRVYTLEQNSGGNVPTKTSDLVNDSGFITSASVPSTATSTSTVTPSTIQLTFTFNDDTTQTVTLMTGATVSTTTTLS